MPIKIEIADIIEKTTKIDVVQWLKNEGDIVEEDEGLVIVSISESDAIQVNAGQEGILFKILIPEGATNLTGKETPGLIAIIGDQKEDISKSIMQAEYLNRHDNDPESSEDNAEQNDKKINDVSAGDDRKLIAAQPSLADSSALRSLLVLIATPVVGWAGSAVARTLGTSSDPNGPVTLLTLGVVLCLIVTCLYYMTKIPEEHGEDIDSLLSSGVSCTASFIAFLVAMFYRQSSADFYLFITAAGCALMYAGYQNTKRFEFRDGVITTLVEVAFIPFVSLVAVAAIVVRNSENSKAENARTRRATMNGAGFNNPVIGAVVEHARGTFTVYDETNQRIAQITFAGAELAGYSASGFQLRANGRLYLYNSRGQRTGNRTL